MKINIKLLIFFCGLVTVSFGQQDPHFSHYMFQTLFYNPGYSGVEGVAKVSAIHRTQWAGYNSTFDGQGAPSTQVISLSAPILRFRSGGGLVIVHDQLAATTNMQVQASYAYHFGFKDSKLSFGVRGGLYSMAIDYDKYRANEADDPLLGNGKESQVRPDLALGIYYRALKYFAGVGFNHMIKSEFSFGIDELRNPLQNHLTFTGGYDYELNHKITLTPSAFINTDFKTYSFDINVMATYDQKMWGGLSYRQSEAIVVLLGYSFFKDNALKLGYAFDYVIVARSAKQATSHELTISYALPPVTSGNKSMIRTPRFRH